MLPMFGIKLPLTKTLIVLTFLLGLLPVIGNLMSNTLITIVGLSLSIWVAMAALGYLIFIHKLEYFLNARIVGGQISAKSWELLWQCWCSRPRSACRGWWRGRFITRI
jgi:predicted PurR-regulated permease PerM